MTEQLEALTVGRIGVDLYAEELNASFTEARRFQKSIGGSPTNVAVALARLGHRAAVLTKVGDDPLGEYVRTALEDEFGVDTRFVGTDPTLQTPIVVAALDPPEDPQFVFYREPRAPDSTILPEDVDLELVDACRSSGSARARSPSSRRGGRRGRSSSGGHGGATRSSTSTTGPRSGRPRTRRGGRSERPSTR